MIKIIPYNAWPTLHDGPQLESVKIASCGLRGNDFAEFVKRASHPLATWVREHPPLPGEVYTHNIALGAYETVGQNRNADIYKKAMLERDHKTFEKYARFYMDHKNSDPARSYGIIKRAHWVPDLGRVELIIALNATKQAAERNGGLIAESTLTKLASNQDVAISQSCRVPGDYCNSCNHFARSRAEYCTPSMCKYGGCRDNLGRIFDDGFHLGVDNRNCTFFDESDVSRTRGADRISFITGKVAGDAYVPGGAELAEMLNMVAPDHLLEPQSLASLVALRKLAAAMSKPLTVPASDWDECLTVRGKLAGDKTFKAANDHQQLAELIADGVILPPSRWLALVTDVSDYRKCAAVFAGGLDVQRDLLSRPDLHDILADTTAPAANDSRLSAPGTYGWMSPSVKAMAKESAMGVLAAEAGVNKVAHVSTPPKVRSEAAAHYLAYQGKVLATHQHSPTYAVLEAECLRHNTGNTW